MNNSISPNLIISMKWINFLKNTNYQNSHKEKQITWSPTYINETELIINNLPQNKSPNLDSFTCEFYHLMKKWSQFSKVSSRKLRPAWLITPNHKDITGKDNHRPICVVNKDTKTLNKILAKWIQPCVKTIIHHSWVPFLSDIQWYKSLHHRYDQWSYW